VACLATTIALAFGLIVHGSELLAADDIQQIKVGAQILYVPKTWIGFNSVWAGASSGAAIKIPQPGTVDVAQLTMHPNFQWRDFNFGGLPKFILIGYSPPESENKLSDKYKRMIDDAESLTPDRYGFVRIAKGFERPGEPPTWERFVYKGYRTKYGEALIVESSNTSGVWSSAGVRTRDDVRIQYLFTSPENTWWDLYEHVMAVHRLSADSKVNHLSCRGSFREQRRAGHGVHNEANNSLLHFGRLKRCGTSATGPIDEA